MNRRTFKVWLLLIVMLLISGVTRAAPSAPIPEPQLPLFQIGGQATETGAAVNFWIDGYTVKMFYVLADGQFYPNEMQLFNCEALQATVAIGGNAATVFVLCATGETQMVRFALHDTFTPQFAVPSVRLYLPLVAR